MTRGTRRQDDTDSSGESLHKTKDSNEPSGITSHLRGYGFIAVGDDGNVDDDASQDRAVTIVTRVGTIVLSAMAFSDIRVSFYWVKFAFHICSTTTFLRWLVFVFAWTMWVFPTYFCQAFQEYLDTGNDRSCCKDRSCSGVHWFHRIMGTTSKEFYGTHGEPTNHSRAVSCFCANSFIVNAAYLLSSMWYGNAQDMKRLWAVVGAQSIMWGGLTMMHAMAPKSDNPVFDLLRRVLGTRHARNTISLLQMTVVPSIVKLFRIHWDALCRFEPYTIAFFAVFCVDVAWYTLRLFKCDDPMYALTSKKGDTSVEVYSLQYLMMSMLCKGVYLIASLGMSDEVKKVWIVVEVFVQLFSAAFCFWVSQNYLPEKDDNSNTHHTKDMIAKTVVLVCVVVAFSGSSLKLWTPVVRSDM